jgi:hypothetical protein
MIIHRLTIETYEESVGDDYPVVAHIFRGATKKEALGYYNAHLKFDEFLRLCQESGQFKTVTCRNEWQWDIVEI